ncbi:MAG: type II toxin-antitoxin system HicB family antitoxin [Clostridia bacterium]|nr:type II toxin-antitoxin system HicB family antitoxin [Clostridia bacterium]
MKKVSYIAIFEPGSDGYSVYFPDLPGCTSYGKNFEEAQREAKEALGLHLYGMEKSGEEIPAPSDKVEPFPGTAEGYLVSIVTVFPELVRIELDNRRIRTNVTIPAWLKGAAEKKGANFSQLLEAALLEFIEA